VLCVRACCGRHGTTGDNYVPTDGRGNESGVSDSDSGDDTGEGSEWSEPGSDLIQSLWGTAVRILLASADSCLQSELNELN